MKHRNDNEKLLEEKEKLNRLIEDALEKGIPLVQNEAIMEQNRKVDELVARVQKGKEQDRKDPRER